MILHAHWKNTFANNLLFPDFFDTFPQCLLFIFFAFLPCYSTISEEEHPKYGSWVHADMWFYKIWVWVYADMCFFYKDLSTGQYVLCDCVCLLLDGINMPLVGDKRWKWLMFFLQSNITLAQVSHLIEFTRLLFTFCSQLNKSRKSLEDVVIRRCRTTLPR